MSMTLHGYSMRLKWNKTVHGTIVDMCNETVTKWHQVTSNVTMTIKTHETKINVM